MMPLSMMTTKELNDAIDEARQDMVDAWEAQEDVTTANGYSAAHQASVTRLAKEAEAYYKTLIDHREASELHRVVLGKIITRNGGVLNQYTERGPWEYGFYGRNKILRAMKLVKFCEASNMPVKVRRLPGGVGVSFSRTVTHDNIIATNSLLDTITPKFSLHPAGTKLERETDAANLQTTRMAIPGEGGARLRG